MAIGKVIKSDAPEVLVDRPQPRTRGGVVNAEAFEAHQEAKTILEKAQHQAAEILAAAEAQKRAIFENERFNGYQKGLADAGQVLAKAQVQRGEMLKSSTQEILALALKVAEKIIGADLERDPTVLARICANAIENVRSAKAMVIRLNPKTAATLKSNTVIFSELLGKSLDITFKEDPEIEPNGCIIQTEFGTIDAQLSTQLEMLRDILLPDDGKDEGPA